MKKNIALYKHDYHINSIGENLPGIPLVGLDEDEDIVDTDGENEEGDDLEDDEGGGYTGETKCS